MENDPIKRINASYIKLTALMLKQMVSLDPENRQRFLQAMDLPDDHLLDIYKMLNKKSEIRPLVKEELEKRGITVP